MPSSQVTRMVREILRESVQDYRQLPVAVLVCQAVYHNDVCDGISLGRKSWFGTGDHIVQVRAHDLVRYPDMVPVLPNVEEVVHEYRMIRDGDHWE